MLRSVLAQKFLGALAIVILGLILYGRAEGLPLVTFLLAFAGWRLVGIVREGLRKSVTAEEIESFREELIEEFRSLDRGQLDDEAETLNLPSGTAPEELARVLVEHRVRQHPPPRRKSELFAEALGVVAFVVLLPAVVGLFSRDFFSWRRPFDWAGCVIAGLGVALYFVPHLWFRRSRVARTLWWAFPAGPAVVLLLALLHWRHPYLDPFNPDRERLAAERVLGLSASGQNVVAGSHADWVLRHARTLDGQERTEEAVFFIAKDCVSTQTIAKPRCG